ncbi:hypothetical protein [Undibacterium sp. TJN19]|uniref:hypothetical protein n=1 Tax=Undibacterium sp. TJN19 TaxID=3413055 RepID=UPI003BF26D3B
MEPKDIVCTAWQNSGSSQVRFAALLSKSQPMLSKYISCDAVPPVEVIILCMNKCGFRLSPNISATALFARILKELSGDVFADARLAINQILDYIAGHSDRIVRH